MTVERYTTDQVLAFLDSEELGEEDFLGEEIDGQMEGSDEEFYDLEEMEIEGKCFVCLFF